MTNALQDMGGGWFGEEDHYGIPEQQTRVRVIINSHISDNDLNGTIDCSDDTISLQTSKTIKGGGGAQFTLVPRRNYINYIFPDDWVNIWINPGDGRGYIRVFFGFVDRISRNITTSGDGQPSTIFTVVCSDFTKAFDKTFIYFNPHVADREDFVGNFAGTKNLAGAALRTKGVSVFGTPADIVLNLSHLLLGWNAQFTMPKSYPNIGPIMKSSREYRRKWVLSRLSDEVKTAVGTQTVTQWLDSLKEDSKEYAKKIREDRSFALGVLQTIALQEAGGTTAAVLGLGSAEEKLKKLQKALETTDAKTLGGLENPETLAVKFLLIERGFDPDLPSSRDIQTALRLENTLLGERSLLDLIDFSFVEYGAIDGSIVSTAIWTQQGTLWSIMNSFSNPIINELFCDLRPITMSHTTDGIWDEPFLFDPDEHGTVAGTETSVRFVPALIMREYPFGTIEDIDLTSLRILDKYKNKPARARIGAIFSTEPNVPGRHITTLRPVLNEYGFILHPYGSKNNVCVKHLDVHVLSVKDIVAEDIGRSDADTVNLLELYSDGLIGEDMKFMTQEVQPVANPISVARHGLRVRTYNTKFARFSSKQKGLDPKTVDSTGTRRKLIRWVLMLDHWYQHNIEYLNGTFTTRAFPEVRVGCRLDIYERRESYYIEGVNHQWQYPEPLLTTFTVSRGQRNDPFPLYEKPALKAFGGNRQAESRLANLFLQKDPSAVIRALTVDPLRTFNDSSEEDTNFIDLLDGANPLTYVKKSVIQAGASDFLAGQLARANEEAAQKAYSDQVAELTYANIIRGDTPIQAGLDAIDIVSTLMKSPSDSISQSISPFLSPNAKGTVGGGRNQ